MLTNAQFVEFVTKAYKAGWVYWYGTYGKPCSMSLYNSKKRQYPSHYGDSRTSKYMQQIAEGRWCADCVGLGKGFVWSNGQFETLPKYNTNGCPDKSADGMFSYAKSHGARYGKISTIPEIPGLAVRMSGHVGYYVGNGYVIEERGFAYGCVKTKLKDRKWTDWYEFPGVTYTEVPSVDPEPIKPVVHTGNYVEVTHGNYYVRVEPRASSDRIGVVRNGEYHPYLGITTNGWYNIEFNGRSVWVSSKCGEITNEDPELKDEGKTFLTVKKGSWNVRTGPSTSYKSLGTVHGGDKFEYLGEEKDNWYKINAVRFVGWISGKAIKK